MASGEPCLFIDYCAKDFLDGTQLLNPLEELAYRRICDMIYDTNDRVPNDDRMLAWATKTGKRWQAIKKVLTGGERPKLLLVEGRVTNLRCQKALANAARKVDQKREAGRASAGTRKSLKNLKQHRTDVREPVRSAVPNEPKTIESEESGSENESLEPREESAKTAPTPQAAPEPVARERPAPLYGFVGRVVRLTQTDLDRWRARYYGIPDILGVIQSADDYYAGLEPAERKRWFIRLSKALDNIHQKFIAAEKEAQHGRGRLSPMGKLWAGAQQLIDEWDREEGNLGPYCPPDVPLLDSRRSH